MSRDSGRHLLLDMCVNIGAFPTQDSGDRLLLDMERARREGWKFGAKLVRGAYMYLERARAEELHYPSPVWDTLDETHANYNRYPHAVHSLTQCLLGY